MSLKVLMAVGALACGGLAYSLPAAAQVGGREVAVSDGLEAENRYPDRLLAWPGGVTSLADVTYSTLPGYRPMTVDIYMPPREMGPRPLVMFIHGGAWMGGDTRHSGAFEDFPAMLAGLAKEGFVVVSLEYRLSREAKFPAQLQDVRAALRFLKLNAARYGIDPERVGVWGASAGGHLSALAALTCGRADLDDERGKGAASGSECVQAAAIWYGVFDMAKLAGNNPSGPPQVIRDLLGCNDKCTSEAYALASPVRYVDAGDPGDPPMLLIHGLQDRSVPATQSSDAERLLRTAGVPVEATYLPGIDHSFIGASPKETRDANLLAMNLTFDFFKRVLAAKNGRGD